MSYHSGALYYNTALCGAGTGPCISTCHSFCNYNSDWVGAYQNYKDCKGMHEVTCSAYYELSASQVCPAYCLYNCNSSLERCVNIRSTGPGCHSGGLDCCKHGHTGSVRKMGDLNKAAVVALTGVSINQCHRLWTRFSPL